MVRMETSKHCGHNLKYRLEGRKLSRKRFTRMLILRFRPELSVSGREETDLGQYGLWVAVDTQWADSG